MRECQNAYLQEWVRYHVLVVLCLGGGGPNRHAISVGQLVVKVVIVEWQVLGKWLPIVLEVRA